MNPEKAEAFIKAMSLFSEMYGHEYDLTNLVIYGDLSMRLETGRCEDNVVLRYFDSPEDMLTKLTEMKAEQE